MTPKYVMLHHSLTKDSGTVSWTAIHRYHTQTLGWSDIGYHFGVERVAIRNGTEERIEVLVGRDWLRRGAHCPQGAMNRKAIAICMVGNFDEAPPPQDQWQRTVRFTAFLLRAFALTPSSIVGHREYNPLKSCPGRMFDLDKFRTHVAEHGIQNLRVRNA